MAQDRSDEARARIGKGEPARLEHVTHQKEAGQREAISDILRRRIARIRVVEKCRQREQPALPGLARRRPGADATGGDRQCAALAWALSTGCPTLQFLVTFVLKVAAGEDSAERELEFELAYQRSLTTQQRFQIMFSRSRLMLEQLARHGHRKPAAIVKRA